MPGKRLIDANALEDRAYEIYVHASPEFKTRMNTLKELIDHAPTIDAVEVVHAYWKERLGEGYTGCSKCDFIPYNISDNYCPNCGAKMDGGVGNVR